jgi:hypothetical protein
MLDGGRIAVDWAATGVGSGSPSKYVVGRLHTQVTPTGVTGGIESGAVLTAQ